jgi:O-antigen/teichoic acid export membrane protein/lipopolysaccharide/colanic/teichoic acid biosynthesis glycosyltransferase
MPSLSKLTSDAFAWRLVTEASRLVLAVGVQVILARMLPVEAFGMLAIAMLVVNCGTNLSELGTAPALIQRETITPTHIRVAFSLAVLTGVVLTIATGLGAAAVAALFKTPAVAPILQVVGLMFVLASFGTTAEALLQRSMEYRRLLKVEVVSYGVGFAGVGITVATLGYGVWALAWATLAQAAVKSLILLGMRPHPMRPCLAVAETRQLLGFGVGISLSRVAGFTAQNADYFVVARWLGAEALGLYSRAAQLMAQPITHFSSILNGVLFPAYSTIQSDTARLRRGYLTSLSVSALVVFPVLATLALTAPELMDGVFGPKWAGAATPFRILCVGGAGYCIYNLADSLVRAKGAVYAKFFYHSVYAVCVFAAAIIGRRWGISGVAIGVVAAIGVVYVLMARLSLQLTGCSWSRFFFAQWSAVVVSGATLAAGVPAHIALHASGLPSLARLAVCAGLSSAAAIIAVLCLPERWLLPAVASLVTTFRDAIREWAVRVRRRAHVGRLESRGLPHVVDVCLALLLLIAVAPLMAAIALAVAVSSSGPVLFRQRRMGRGGRTFELLKFRTMAARSNGPEVTASGDPRITPVGRVLRRTKLDELPELWNVVRGDMALVGPRPEAVRYVVATSPVWQQVLSVRPGLTDTVTVRLRNEEALLAASEIDHECYYRKYLLPYKLRASADYLATRTWRRDVAVLWRTAVAVVAPSRIVPPSPSEIAAAEDTHDAP